MDVTPNLSLPYLLSGQSQKHVTHNEALRRLDALVQLIATSRSAASPPATPANGECFIVATAATGNWAGKEGRLAVWQDGAWVFIQAKPGWRAWLLDEGALVVWDGAAWGPIPVDLPDALRLERLSIGADLIGDATLVVAGDSSVFTGSAGDHRLVINRESETDFASIVFQTDFVGRAELGLAGEDALSVKVTANGDTWRTVLKADSATAQVALPSAGVAFGGQEGAVLIHDPSYLDEAAASFRLTCFAFPDVNLPASERANVVWRLGYNTSAGGGVHDPAEPALALVYESYYRQNGTANTESFEFHLSMTDTAGAEHRPLSFQLPRNGVSGDSAAAGAVQVDKLTLATFAGAAAMNWNLLSPGYLQIFHDLSTTYYFNVNNAPVLRQRNAADTDYVFHPYIDNADRFQIRTPTVQFADGPDAVYNSVAFIKSWQAHPDTRLLNVSHDGAVDGGLFASAFSGHATGAFVLDIQNYGDGSSVIQAGAGVGDPQFRTICRGGAAWSFGADNSDDDSFKICAASDIGDASAAIRIDRTTRAVEVLAPLNVATHATSDVPSAADAGAAAVIFVTDGDAGFPCCAVSDGANWRRIALGPAISSS